MEIPQLPGSHLCSWWVFQTYLKLLEGAKNNIKNTNETQLYAMIQWQLSSGIPMAFFGVAQLIPGWSWRVAKSLRKSGQVEVQGVDRTVLGRSCGAKKCGHPAPFFWVTPKKLRQKWIDHD